MNQGVSVGPKILELVLDDELNRKLKPADSAAREVFVQVVLNVLGNHSEENYAELVGNMLKAYQLKSTRMSLKMDFLCSQPNFFPTKSRRCQG